MNLNTSAEYELTVNVTSYMECDVTGETPVRELLSDTSVQTTLHACTAPATPNLMRNDQTADSIFVATVSIPSGIVSRLQLLINRELISHPTSAGGVFTRIDPLDASKFYFYPTDLNVQSPNYIAQFDSLDENEFYSFEISAIYDGVSCPSTFSKSSKIFYRHSKATLILGLAQSQAYVAIVGAVAGVVLVTILAIYFMNGKFLAAKAATSVAPVYQVSNRVEFMRPKRGKVEYPQPKEERVKKFERPVTAASFSSAVASTSHLIREPTTEVLKKLQHQRRGACITPRK
ncbi:uncharacterized protein LOC142356489 [Convolutriloba macropyga]|uniref:uncharacterized protein LOC142356489 n=1 Tax=Convolutriloba macropyga TaxID=536237 RepID=UPI003F51B78F